jgi:CheY-like chemotaxis protein
MKIYIVDDSLFQLNQIKSILENLNHDVKAFSKAADLLEDLKSDSCDCVVSDLLMPEIDGFQLLQEIKKDKPELPVIILSANIQDSVKTKCMDLGAKIFLNKPTSKEEMEEGLASIEKGA